MRERRVHSLSCPRSSPRFVPAAPLPLEDSVKEIGRHWIIAEQHAILGLEELEVSVEQVGGSDLDHHVAAASQATWGEGEMHRLAPHWKQAVLPDAVEARVVSAMQEHIRQFLSILRGNSACHGARNPPSLHSFGDSLRVAVDCSDSGLLGVRGESFLFRIGNDVSHLPGPKARRRSHHLVDVDGAIAIHRELHLRGSMTKDHGEPLGDAHVSVMLKMSDHTLCPPS